MSRKEINVLNMLKSVVQFFTENPALFSNKAALEAAIQKLKAHIAEIESLENSQISDTKADTALKAETKTNLINAMLIVFGGITAHAAATNDIRLRMAADVSKYELGKMRDHNLIVEARSTYELALPIANALLEWEVTQDHIDDIDTNSSAFNAKDPAIKIIKARSTQTTKEIRAKLDETNNFVKETLDAMMLPYKISKPTEYGQYQKARSVINIAGGHSKTISAEDNETAK